MLVDAMWWDGMGWDGMGWDARYDAPVKYANKQGSNASVPVPAPSDHIIEVTNAVYRYVQA